MGFNSSTINLRLRAANSCLSTSLETSLMITVPAHDRQSHRIFLILHEFHQPELWCIYIYGCHVCRMSLLNKPLVTSSDITYNNSPRISCVFATIPAFCQDTHEAHRAVVVLCPKESPPCVFSGSWHCHGHLRWMNQQHMLDFIAYESWKSIFWCFRCHPACYPRKMRKDAQQSQVQAQDLQV